MEPNPLPFVLWKYCKIISWYELKKLIQGRLDIESLVGWKHLKCRSTEESRQQENQSEIFEDNKKITRIAGHDKKQENSVPGACVTQQTNYSNFY